MWGDRYDGVANPLMRRYMEISVEKKSLVCLAADCRSMAELFTLIDLVGPYIAALKTHVDLVRDWDPKEWSRFCELANNVDLLIFEDRKFADIGKISKEQMGGVYNIASWADLVTSHLISGSDIIDGLQASWKEIGREGGVLLLAQMSSRGNLLSSEYTDKVVAEGCEHPGVFGFIGNGSRPTEITELREKVGWGKMIWTPGVNLAIGDGDMGQRYGSPKEAVLAGSDCVIVGSGIHGASNPSDAAKKYAEESWSGFLERVS